MDQSDMASRCQWTDRQSISQQNCGDAHTRTHTPSHLWLIAQLTHCHIRKYEPSVSKEDCEERGSNWYYVHGKLLWKLVMFNKQHYFDSSWSQLVAGTKEECVFISALFIVWLCCDVCIRHWANFSVQSCNTSMQTVTNWEPASWSFFFTVFSCIYTFDSTVEWQKLRKDVADLNRNWLEWDWISVLTQRSVGWYQNRCHSWGSRKAFALNIMCSKYYYILYRIYWL